MPPQGPPGPQPQPAERAAAAAMSAPAAAPAATAAAAGATTHDLRQQLSDDDSLAALASRVSNGGSDGYDQPELRRRRDPDGDQVFCPPEVASPVQDGAKGASASSAGAGNHGYAQACCDEDTHPDGRKGSGRVLADDGAVDGKPKLLTFDDVPQHLQFNPYIVTGYRPMSNFWGSLRSLFYLHNETVNIVTHGIPIVYILLVVPGLVPWARLDRQGHFLAWCHLVGAVSPWVGSFVYHLFMNLQAGERMYNRLLRLDMFGIWICQSFGALPMVTATVYCLPWNVRWLVTSSYCALSLCGLYKAMTAWSPWDRRLSFALPWVSRLALCLVRAVLGGGSPHNMLHLILQDSVSLIGGVVGAVYFPEKYFPGWVDYCLNSHNIMHILTVCAVYSMHCATIQDLEWIASVDCNPAGPPWSPWGSWTSGSLGAGNQSAEL